MSVGLTPSQLGGAAAESPPPAPSAPATPAPSTPAASPAPSTSDVVRGPTDGSEADARASLLQASQHAQQQAGETPEAEVESVVAEAFEEPDPWAEKVRGELTAKDIIEKIKAADGVIPEELLDLEHEYVYGEGEGAERERMTLRDALDLGHKERMQLRDYHRRVHEVHNFEQQVVARARAVEAAIKGLNRQSMFDDLQGLGVQEAEIEEAIKEYARQKIAYRNSTPEQRAWLDAQKQQRAQVMALQREVAELRSVKEQGEAQQFQQQAKSTLRTHMGEAFKKHGLNVGSEYAKSKFQFFLERACDGKPPTREHIYQAALATKQDITTAEREDRLAQAKAQNARQSGGKPLGPRSAAAPAALRVSAQANGRKRGFTMSQLEDKIG